MNDLVLIAAPILVFLSCFMLVFACLLLWQGAQESGREKVKTRIRRLAPIEQKKEPNAIQLLSLVRREGITSLNRMIANRPLVLKTLGGFLKRCGVKLAPELYLIICLLAGLVGSAIVSLMFRDINGLTVVLGFLVGCLTPYLIFLQRRRKRQQKIVEQLPDTLDFFARSLRAGTPFATAIKLASQEIPAPIGEELSATHDELNFGLEFSEAMDNLASRVDVTELRMFVTAVTIQKGTGGNLAELLNRLADLMRKRVAAAGEIRVQASEMKTSARVLAALPFIIAGLLQLISPGYLAPMFESDTGRSLMVFQLIFMVLGYAIINRMIAIKV